jgi:hypothetical protein
MLKAYLIEIAIILIAIWLVRFGWVGSPQTFPALAKRAIRLGGEPKPTAFLLLLV